ncbi:hypothetical protein C8R43DRAFT_550361 [Mycena crocata]|nr:hypothetical protein C8R43DRAFT_550361 [Mycena crocata]
MRFAFTFGTLASLSVLTVANAVICEPGSCWSGGPSNATNFGCKVWAGGVGPWEQCGFEGAIVCNECLPCVQDSCYVSPNQATGSGCTQWAGGVNAWETCGFEGAIICLACPAQS